MKTLKDFDFKDKKVLVRTGYDVPIENGKVTDDTRIKESLPTIRYLLQKGARQAILISHLGRPEGKVIEALRLDPIAKKLQELLKTKVEKLNDCVDVKPTGKIVLLENLRFHPEEEKNDDRFAKKLSVLAGIYVNDAFSVSHRAHASIVAITKYLPSCAGLSVEQEVKALQLLEKPKRPFVVVIGGVKISDKLNFVKKMLEKADKVLIGGAMMFTFYKAQGKETGKSIVEEKGKSTVEDNFIEQAKTLSQNKKLMLPIDAIITEDINKKTGIKTVDINNIRSNSCGVDIGPKTIKKYADIIKEAKTIVWNGPMGIYELKEFSNGTKETARAIAESKATTIIGGGNTIDAVNKFRITGFTHVSTGGGAMLEFLEKGTLPGIEALN